ncbi:AzlC family ABC transporter permease [Thalassobacillus pellis]|uniref:AzlC family ABC transporter permease n=1 Tax=Thalassobacillus pellis TaxID=748008 RepID=UPI0019618C83|nr:AzlC family ABC transporter permease [Thalassobacillus pellis]MBM7551135.1 4-azaleucine resistance transporter AzlC [Thalassobacillus pellis]
MEPKVMDIEADNYITRKHMVKRGFVAGLPIMLGYLPIAVTYGVLARQSGLSNIELTLMSILVFAGAAQFMAANMIAIGTGAAELIIATFVLNFRHFVMSLSFMNRLRGIALKWKVPLSLGLTDETFTVSSLHKKEAKEQYGVWFFGSLILTAYVAWIGGSYLGGVLGDILPARLSQSMGIALYAMFIGLLIPSIKKESKVAVVAVIAMATNFIFSVNGMSDGWAIVLGTLIGGLSGIGLLKEDKP